MRDITAIVIHHSAYPDGVDKFTVRDIDRDHAARVGVMTPRLEVDISSYNPSYPYIGYHELIDVYGKCHPGRGENESGCHCSGYNTHSLAVCLMGTNRYTQDQWDALAWVVNDWKKRYGDLRVLGHQDAPGTHTECPGFSVANWMAGGMKPLPEHLFTR